LEHTFSTGMSLSDYIQVFSATIDTTAWVILLLLFELETYQLPDEVIKGWVKRALHGIRAFCYLFIVYALYGYIVELQSMFNITSLEVADACALIGGEWSYMLQLDEYAVLDASNCVAVGEQFWQYNGFNIIVDRDMLEMGRWLAWTDVINAAAWILVVLVLEFDVRLQLKGAYSGRLLRINQLIKLVLYSTLLAAAIYWWIDGDFLDFWDAFLWLFAFVFIESNLFAWQAETQAAEEASANQ